MWAGAMSMVACQSLTGLSDLDAGEQATSSGGMTAGGSGGVGGEGVGGEGGDGAEGGDGGEGGGGDCGEGSSATCDTLTCAMSPMCSPTSESPFLEAHCVVPCDPMNPVCSGAGDITIVADEPVLVPHCTACTDRAVSCQGDAPCVIDCTGAPMGEMPSTGACHGTTINCGDGPCEVICDAANCDASTIVNCGRDACRVVEGGSTVETVCGSSCDCDPV